MAERKRMQTTVDFETAEQRKKFRVHQAQEGTGMNDTLVALVHRYNADSILRKEITLSIAGSKEDKPKRRARVQA